MAEARLGSAMRNGTVLLVAVLVIGTVGGPAAGVVGAQSQVTLTVSVVTAAGDPVSNAQLTATWDGGSAQASTASNGKAFLDVAEGADVTIEVDHPGFVRNEPFTVTDAGAEEVEVTVYRKSSLGLSVADDEGAVEGVRVVLRKSGSVVEILSTDPRGQVDSGVIEAGEYTVTLFEPGYFQRTVTIDVQGDTSEEVLIEQGSVTVEFLVLDDNFNPSRPVPDATIRGDDFSVATGTDGRREVSLPVNTELSVSVEKDGFDTVEQSIQVREEDMEVEITTRKLPAVNLEVSNERVVVGESVQVTVTDQYGEALPSATVYLDDEAAGQPDRDGLLRVPIDSEGDHTLYAAFEGESSDELTITGVSTAGEVDDPGDDGSTADAVARPAGFLGVPGVGQLHLRSTAIGVALGLVLATLLFFYSRFG